MDEFERLWKETGESGVMVLSTCAGNRVRSRSMSVVVINGKYYCQTNKNYLKCAQIKENPNVSLCYRNFTVEGICRITGRPCDDPVFTEAMKKSFPDAVKRWSSLPEECILEITPLYVRSWIYEEGIPFIETWDIAAKTYRRERQ